jgi:hypothetical protein
MKWLLFVKVKKDEIVVILANINLDKLEIKKYNLLKTGEKSNSITIDNIELNILTTLNAKMTIKDTLYIVSDKCKLDMSYKFIKDNMKRLDNRIINIVDYNTLKIILDQSNENTIKTIEYTLDN